MADAVLEDVMARLRALTPQEQRHVRDMLDQWLAGPVPATGDNELVRELLRAGVLGHLPLAPDPAAYRDRVPIRAQGEPVPQTLLDARR